MARVVDHGAAWYAAIMMVAAVFLVGLLVSVVSGAAGFYVAPYVLGAACLMGVGLGSVVFRKVAEGVVFDPADDTIEIPVSRPYESILDLLSVEKYRRLVRRERVALAAIQGLGERDVALHTSRKRPAGYAYYLDVEGAFGTHAVHFRSDDKRREARAFIERLRRSRSEKRGADVDA